MSLLFVAMFLLAATLGPCNTIPANVIPATQRAAAYAFNIFMIHLLGDISSPVIIGRMSDWLGRPSVTQSFLGRFLAALGAAPAAGETTNLTAGMMLVIPVLVLGGVFFIIGSRHLPADEDRARSLSGGDDRGEVLMH
jgi:MFS transporter, Spinster family, sphingosine-1-phosphate transporter